MRFAVIVSLSLLCLPACAKAKGLPAAAVAATPVPTSASKIARVVFMDKEHACECTRKRVEDTWTALQAAVGTPPELPIQRIHVDTQAAQAGQYISAKPLMAPPGIYFVDQQEHVFELLQGEVKTEEIAAVLKRGSE
ncbi:MAG TPA: hypothetical protein VJ860_04040 [Polyangia bacterium]|nr:hypothetical protein [Polyangia bacterium]